ncbi:hypothetical protein SD436_00705 [Streptococcus sp. 2A/TPW/M5]
MKQWFYKVFTLTVVGMVVYLIFSKDDSLYYHFPWELFAGLGIMSWAVQEGLKMVKAVKRRWSSEKTGVTLVVFVIIPASQACLKGEYHERH